MHLTRKSLAAWLGSTSVLAIVLVVVVNGLLLSTNPLKSVDPQSLPSAHSWVWWATKDFLAEEPAPDVVLLGSSLMMNPIWLNEANFLDADLDIIVNRRISYLDAEVSKLLPNSHTKTFNFALPGAVISDDYMVVRTLLEGKHTPKVVVLGLSPRDLAEDGLKCPAFSDHFRYLKHFTDIEDIADLAMPHIWQRARYYTNQIFYTLGKKLDIQVLCGETMRQHVQQLAMPISAPCKFNKDDINVNLAIYKSELKKGVWIAHPHGAKYFHEVEYEKFKRRYSSAYSIDNQTKWLDLCLKLCQKRGIKVLVANMPLTDSYLGLFAPGVYNRGLETIKSYAKTYDCAFIDLQASGKFSISDFTDGCHMDAGGGKKVLDLLADTIAGNTTLAKAVETSPIQLAGTPATSR